MATPRFATPRDPERPSYGERIARSAADLGRPFAAHQREWADVLGQYDPETGRPDYSEGWVVVPRRGGKTVFVLALLIERLRRHPAVRAFYTAQTAEDATKVLRDEWAPLLQGSALRHALGFRYARGDAGMYVRIGGRRLSRCEVFTPNANALHGRDSDLTVVDEAWSYSLERAADLEAGIRPARWARPGSQLVKVSAGGTEASTWLNSMVDKGRTAPPGVAYWEYSADPEDPNYDPYSEDLWHEVHPGLAAGLVDVEQLRADARDMDRASFERGLLCVWPRAQGSTLLTGWEQLLRPEARPEGLLTLAFDVHPARTSAAIAVAGGGAAELIDHRPGVRWLPDRLAELWGAHEVGQIVRDPAGQAGATRCPEVDVVDMDSAQVAEACAVIVDAIAAAAAGEPELRVRPHPALAAAFAGARTYARGDGRAVWARRTSSADLTPLYALTLAAWAAAEHPAGVIY